MATLRRMAMSGPNDGAGGGQANYVPSFPGLGVSPGDIVFHFSVWADDGYGVPTSIGWYDIPTATAHPTPPPGWTVVIDELVGGTARFYGSYRVVGPSDTELPFMAYIGASPVYVVGGSLCKFAFVAYYDYDNRIEAQDDRSDASATDATSPTLTPSQATSLLLTFHGCNVDPVGGPFALDTPAGMTDLTNVPGGTAAMPIDVHVSEEEITGTSPTGTRVSNPSAGSAGPRCGWSILLPAVGLGGWGVGQVRMGAN